MAEYTLKIIVGPGFPGHATIQIEGPEKTIFLGMGPKVMFGVADAFYDRLTLDNGVSPVGIIRDPAREFTYVDTALYPAAKSFSFEVTAQQVSAALTAAANYQVTNPTYNFFNATICTDYVLKILEAAISGSDVSRLDRTPSVLVNQLTDLVNEGHIIINLGVPFNPHLTGIEMDADAPDFSSGFWRPQEKYGPFEYINGSILASGQFDGQVVLTRYEGGSGQLTTANGTVINFGEGTLDAFSQSNGLMIIGSPTTGAVQFISVDPITGNASISGGYQASAGSTISVASNSINVVQQQSTGTQTTTVNWDGELERITKLNNDLSSAFQEYDPNNTHPYSSFGFTKGADGKVLNPQVTLDPAVAAFTGSIGQIFGSAIGRALAPNDPFARIAINTVAGTIGTKFAQVMAASLSVNASRIDISTILATGPVDLGAAGAGAVASFLVAELGEQLHFTGFTAQLFNSAAGGFAGSLAQQVARDGIGVLAGAAWGNALEASGISVGGTLGSILSNLIHPAESQAGAITGQLLGAVGALAAATAIGQAAGLLLDIIVPGIGSLIGTLLGTMIGDAFGGGVAHPTSVDLIDPSGKLYAGHFWAQDDGGDANLSHQLSSAVTEIVNAYLTAVDGMAIDHGKSIMIGYQTGYPAEPYITGWVPDGAGVKHFASAADAVTEVAIDILRNTEAIGGNLLLKRAHVHSNYADTGTLSGDLQVAQDFERYLDNRDVINALMAAHPDSAFTAGWAATFARVNDLKLNQVGASDFLGGLVGFLDSVANAGLGGAAANATVKRASNGSVIVEVKVANGAEVPGSLSVFADQLKITSNADGQTVQFTVDGGLAARAYNSIGAGASGGDDANDVWFGGPGGVTFHGTGGHDILVGGAHSDTIYGGSGWDFIDGGSGSDTLYGEDGGDILRGGRDTDFLYGGSGNDSFAFARGDGVDRLLDHHTGTVFVGDPNGMPGSGHYEDRQLDGGADTLAFGAGIAVSDIAMSFTNEGLVVVVKDPAHPGVPFWEIADRITLEGWTNPLNRIEFMHFADGTVLDIGASLGSYLVPFGETLSRSSVAENSAIGTVVGTVTASDLNAAAVLTYSLIGDVTGGRFTIDASSGVIRVAGALNYEGTNAWPISVRVTDQNGHSYETPFVIDVTNVNEAPADAWLAFSGLVENSPGGTHVAQVAGSDPDAGTVFSYSLTDDAGGRFFIYPKTGLIVNYSSSTIDYETASSHHITVRATDQGGLWFEKSWDIPVTDVNEAPSGITLSASSVPENSLVGTRVAIAKGIDQDAGTVFSYSLTNDVTGGRFAINASSGEITVTGPLNYEGTNAWPIVVRVADQHGASYASSFTIAVTDVPERMHAVVTDFNGDRKSDILWTRDNGTVAVWDSGQIANAHWIADPGVVPGSWHIRGDGDFDFNGHDDILWQNDNAAVSVWDNGQLAGAHIIAGAGVVPGSLHIAGVGDFDGNHRDDVLWRDDNGAVWIWDDGEIAGAHIVAGAGVVPAGWHIDGIGDFDGNLKDDILWHHDDGRVSMWDDGRIAGAHLIVDPGVVANSWKVAGTGDFDGNGRLDILWRNDNGAVSIWDNGQIGNAHIVAGAGSIPAGWHIEGVGDFDGNGRDDVLWRNDNSTVSVWDNGTLAGAHWIADPGQVASSWHIV